MSATAWASRSGARGVAPQIRPVAPIASRGGAGAAAPAVSAAPATPQIAWQNCRRPGRPFKGRIASIIDPPAHRNNLRITQDEMRCMLAATLTSMAATRQGAGHLGGAVHQRTWWAPAAVVAAAATVAVLVQRGEGARAPSAYAGWR